MIGPLVPFSPSCHPTFIVLIFFISLAQAVLSRHLLTPELREIMLSLAKSAIQGEEENLRQQSRHLTLTFMTTYNPKKIRLKEFTELFLMNLEYPVEHGRLVCLTMLSDLLDKMGAAFYDDNALLYFQLFATRLSDESSPVRHKAAHAITAILTHSLSNAALVEKLFDCIRGWLNADDVAFRRMGFHTATLFVQAQKSDFVPRLDICLAALSRVIRVTEFASPTEADMLEYDHLLINALSLLASIVEHGGAGVWTGKRATVKKFCALFDGVRELLLHEHEWVRIRSLAVYWGIFERQLPEGLAGHELFREDATGKLSALAHALMHQLKSYSDREDYYVMWAKCMGYVVRAIAFLPAVESAARVDEKGVLVVVDGEEEVKEEEDGESVGRVDGRGVSVPFVVRGVCREAVYEALHEPKKTTKV